LSDQKPVPPRLSLVVLPFANISGTSEQDSSVDGVTESLTTDLSQMSGSLVIGRNTAFSYKNKTIDLKQVGRELNVHYILEGSVQRSASRVRVNVQLIDAESGNHLWADRFDKPVADLFDMQDEIVARLANALNAQLIKAEARRSECVPDPDSMDLYFQGMSWYNKGLIPDNLSEARKLFGRALALDPGNVDAVVGIALTSVQAAATHTSDDRAARLAEAEALAIKALTIAPEMALAHLCLGCVQIYTNRAAQGISECERALVVNRNLAAAHAYIGLAKYFIGRGEEIEAHIGDALRLSPRDTRFTIGKRWRASQKFFWGRTKRPSRSCGAQSRSTEISSRRISISRPLSPGLAASKRRASRQWKGWRRTQLSPSGAIRATLLATIQCFSPRAKIGPPAGANTATNVRPGSDPKSQTERGTTTLTAAEALLSFRKPDLAHHFRYATPAGCTPRMAIIRFRL
jgi:TolB-like protein